MKLNVAGKTDTGLLNDHNEDHFVARRELSLYMVADGVGGLEAGELASKVACRLIEQSLVGSDLRAEARRHDLALANAIREANLKLFGLGQRQDDKRGVGTTIAALWFHGDRVLFAYVGDSRIYLFRDGVLRQLSRDQKAGRYRLAASLGQDRGVDVRLGMVRLRRRDRFLLCTDGLYGPVVHADLTTIVDSEPEPAQCCERLVFKANQCGGPDNITAVVADVVEADPPQPWRFSRVRLDATSLLSRLLRGPWLPRAAGVLLLAAIVLWCVLPRGARIERPEPPRVGARLAFLAQEANEKARDGDEAGTLAALKELVRQAVREGTMARRSDLGLEGAAEALFNRAAEAVWDELYAPAREKLANLAGTAAESYVEVELRATWARVERIHGQFREGNYQHVASTFATLPREIDTIIRRAKSDLARHKERLVSAIARLRAKAEEFEAGNPIRRALERHMAAAAAALKAGDTAAARRHVKAAEAKLDDAPDEGRD